MTSTISTIETADGLTLLTRRWACNEPRARVLIVHGLGEHSGRYEHVGAFLVEKGFAVSAFDLRGHGASGGRRMDIEEFDQYLDDLEMVFGTVEEDMTRIIYGHSMGGLISTSYAVSDRPQPALYVLSAPALEADVPAPLKIVSKALGGVLPTVRMPNSIKGSQLSRDPAVGEAYFADPLVETKATARFGSKFLAQLGVVKDRLDSLSTPALVIHGADDELVPPQASAPLAALPGVERRLFPGLRHEIHNEPEQDEVLGFVVDWLDAQLA